MPCPLTSWSHKMSRPVHLRVFSLSCCLEHDLLQETMVTTPCHTHRSLGRRAAHRSLQRNLAPMFWPTRGDATHGREDGRLDQRSSSASNTLSTTTGLFPSSSGHGSQQLEGPVPPLRRASFLTQDPVDPVPQGQRDPEVYPAGPPPPVARRPSDVISDRAHKQTTPNIAWGRFCFARALHETRRKQRPCIEICKSLFCWEKHK